MDHDQHGPSATEIVIPPSTNHKEEVPWQAKTHRTVPFAVPLEVIYHKKFVGPPAYVDESIVNASWLTKTSPINGCASKHPLSREEDPPWWVITFFTCAASAQMQGLCGAPSNAEPFLQSSECQLHGSNFSIVAHALAGHHISWRAYGVNPGARPQPRLWRVASHLQLRSGDLHYAQDAVPAATNCIVQLEHVDGRLIIELHARQHRLDNPRLLLVFAAGHQRSCATMTFFLTNLEALDKSRGTKHADSRAMSNNGARELGCNAFSL